MPAPRRGIGRPSNQEVAERHGVPGAIVRALANRTRRKMLLLLAAHPLPVHAITSHFTVSRPMISKHLQVLTAANLVVGTVLGRERVYRVAENAHAEQAIELLAIDQGHEDAILRLREHLERDSDP